MYNNTLLKTENSRLHVILLETKTSKLLLYLLQWHMDMYNV